MIQSSSKRLSKIKKKLKKQDTSDYYFLISSLQGQSNKQNYQSNNTIINRSSTKNSIQLKKSAMISSFDNFKQYMSQSVDNGYASKIKMRKDNNNNVPFLQNVKFLKNSRMQIEISQQVNKYAPEKNTYKKNIELSHKASTKGKKINESNRNPHKSNKFTQNISHQDKIQQKLEAYVQFVNQLFDEVTKSYKIDNYQNLSRKKCLLQTLGRQLVRSTKKNVDISTIRTMSKSIQVSNFNSFPSKVVSKELQPLTTHKQQPCYKKLVDQLSHENTKLTQLISQHERKNIKMFIQMNENQSKEIQKCKKYLSSLYDKYKLLEKSLVKENQKYKKVCDEKVEMEKMLNEIQKNNAELKREADRMRGIIQDKGDQSVSKLSFEEEPYNTMFNFNLNENNNKHQKSISKYISTNPMNYHKKNTLSLCHNPHQTSKTLDRSFITNRNKASSCLSTHLQNEQATVTLQKDEIMSCSTITKNKNMKKNKNLPVKRTCVGIDVKVQSNEINELESELKAVKKNLSKTKQQLNDQVVLKLALQKQLANLQIQLRKKTQTTEKMQSIINEQLTEIEKLMILNSKISQDLKFAQSINRHSSTNVIKPSEVTNHIFSKVNQVNQVNQISNTIMTKSNLQAKAALMESEYRIIALQAGLLQSFVKFSS